MTTEGQDHRERIPMYIGLGTLVLIVVIVLLVMMMRGRRR
jgi:Tfp pilus assembly protein PilN